MGPFELQDLVGVDVGFEVSRSFHEQSFGEPRWRPSPAERAHGRRRAARPQDRPRLVRLPRGEHRPTIPSRPAPGGGDGRLVVVAGELAVAHELRALRPTPASTCARPDEADGEVPWLILDCGAEPEAAAPGRPQSRCCAPTARCARSTPAAARSASTRCRRLTGAPLVELTRGPAPRRLAAERAEAFFAALGLHTAWVGDAPGLVLGRIVCQLVNEAAFAVGEGVGSRQDVDAGMVLGLNHPRGPLAWAT